MMETLEKLLRRLRTSMKNHDNITQRSPEWHHIRKGKVSGTVLKNLMGTPRAKQDAIYELVAGRLTVGIGDEDENPMERGVRLEDSAIAEFELKTGLNVSTTGISQSDDNANIINSPDGLIGEDQAIEVKCMGGKNHVKMWLQNKIPDDYWWQVVQYFVVNEKLQKLYFVGYNPDIPVHPLHIIEVERESIGDLMAEAVKAQTAALQEVEAILSTIIKL